MINTDDKKRVQPNTSERDKEIEKLINSGELTSMTECAYGKPIADEEKNNTLKKKKKK